MFDGINYFLKLCWHYNCKYVLFLALNQFLKFGLVVTNLFFPKIILDALFTQKNVYLSVEVIFIYLILTCMFGISIYYVGRLANNERTKTFHYFQLDLGMHMMSTKLEMLESERFLSLKAKAQQYLYGGGQGFASVLENSFEMFGTLLSLILCSIIVLKLNWIILIILIIVIAINAIFNWSFQKKNVEINMEKAEQERRSEYYSNIFQDYSYGKEIRVYNLPRWLKAQYDNQLNLMQSFYCQLNKNNCMFSQISVLLSTVQQIIIYGYLIYSTIHDFLSVGMFTLYLNSIQSFNSSLKSLIELLITAKQYTTYYKAFLEYIGKTSLDEFGHDSMKQESENDSLTFGHLDNFIIEFKEVNFIYPQNEYYSLRDINIKIQKGDKLAIVGKNGAGKSTFIKLLLRIYTPTSGEILLNGVNINQIDYEQYITIFSTVFQDYKLFAQSISDNIVLNNKNPDKEAVSKILKNINLFDKLNKLPNKFDTCVYKLFDDSGYVPSEGEAQKIAIARAIYKDASIVILDEPSSSMDPQSEYELYQLFDNMTKAKTCVFISHRLAITAFSNRVCVFDNGSILELGTHKELLEKKGYYYTMYKMQAQYYD